MAICLFAQGFWVVLCLHLSRQMKVANPSPRHVTWKKATSCWFASKQENRRIWTESYALPFCERKKKKWRHFDTQIRCCIPLFSFLYLSSLSPSPFPSPNLKSLLSIIYFEDLLRGKIFTASKRFFFKKNKMYLQNHTHIHKKFTKTWWENGTVKWEVAVLKATTLHTQVSRPCRAHLAAKTGSQAS